MAAAIIFTSRASGASDVQVRRIDLDGSNPRPIGTGGAIFRGYVQAVGDHIYFKVLQKGSPVAYRVPLGWRSARAAVCRSVRGCRRVSSCTASPRTNGGPSAPTWTRRVPAWPSCLSTEPGRCASFRTPTRPGVASVRHLVAGRTCVRRPGRPRWGRRTSGGSRSTAPPPRPVTTFTSEQIMNYRWSRDGKTLAMSRGTYSADVVLIASDDTRD